MTDEELKELMESTRRILNECDNLNTEMEAMDEHKKFLLEEYKTNKRYFREEPGRTTIEDVIKTCFEYGWSAHRQFEYDQNRKKDEVQTS